MMTKEQARVYVYDEHLASALDEFCHIVWPESSRDAIPPSKRACLLKKSGTDQPENPAPTFLFMKDERAIGHVATIPVRLSTAAGVFPGHWIVGLVVLPEYRNGLVGPLLIKEVNRTLYCAMSLHVEAPVLRILTGLKWKYKGVLPQYLRVLRAHAVVNNVRPRVIPDRKTLAIAVFRVLVGNRLIRRVTAGGLAFALGLWGGVGALIKPKTIQAVVREEQGFDGTYTDLWRSVGGKFQAAMVRDELALRARYERKKNRYRLLACRQGNTLLGYCLLKTKTFSEDACLGNIKIGTIVDCLYDPELSSVGQLLMDHAVQLFAKADTDVVLCTASLTKVRRLLMANGFFRIPGNLNFAYHTREGLPLDDIPLDAWHLMRGDSDADQNF